MIIQALLFNVEHVGSMNPPFDLRNKVYRTRMNLLNAYNPTSENWAYNILPRIYQNILEHVKAYVNKYDHPNIT